MKKIFLSLAIVLAIVTVFSSCVTGKKDCRGVKHTKQPGGFYL
jgi:uncharacterized alpha/beta hydrolase family protein